MSDLFEDAIARARQLPDDKQDALAATLFAHMSGGSPIVRLTAEQVQEVEATKSRLAAGHEMLVSEADMEAFWQRCGL
jgi:hypothetical protein